MKSPSPVDRQSSLDAESRSTSPLLFLPPSLPSSVGQPGPSTLTYWPLIDTEAVALAVRSIAQPVLSRWMAMPTQPRLIFFFFFLKGQRKYSFQTRQNLLSFHLVAP